MTPTLRILTASALAAGMTFGSAWLFARRVGAAAVFDSDPIMASYGAIALLERSLAEASTGKVGYSPAAVELMRGELEKRRRQP